MTWIPSVETQSVTLCTPAQEAVVQLGLVGNNEKPQRIARLNLGFMGSYPAEIQVEPGPQCKGPGIIYQIMGFGPVRPDGRQRLALSLNMDSAGGLAAYIDSTVTSGSTCSPVPLLLAMGEQMYVGLYPDQSIFFRVGAQSIRMPLDQLIRHLRRVPK